MGKIFVVMGKSATGKDTIYKRLLEHKELGLNSVVLYTTRPIRSGEKNGIEYFFVNQEKMEKFIEEKKIIEIRSYQTIHGVWNYFTADDGQIDLHTSNYLMIQTLEGYEQIVRFYGKEAAVPIYIEVDDGVRLDRALQRERLQMNPKYSEMCRRYLADEADFSEDNLKKSGIIKRYKNIELEECLKNISMDIFEMIKKPDI